MRKSTKMIIVCGLVSLLALGNVFAAGEQEGSEASGPDFPNKTITLICPYGAGGGTDATARAIAHVAEKSLGTSIVVQNITGGTGIVGISTMMKSKPDGYTLSTVSGELISLPTLGLAPSDFDFRQAKPIMQYNADPNCFIVKADSELNSLDDLIAKAKSNPGDVVMATTGSGGTHHLTALMFENATDTDLKVIPYQEGANAVVVGLLGGHSEVGCVGPAEAGSYLKSGDVKLLGIAIEERLDAYPDTPTFVEQGVNISYGTWRGIAAPYDTPDEIVSILADIFVEASKDPEFIDFMNTNGFGIDRLDTADFQAKIDSQVPIITDVAQIYIDSQK